MTHEPIETAKPPDTRIINEMARLIKTQLADVIGSLPDIEALSCSPETTQDALYICALGFENRCISIPERLAYAGYRTDRAVYLRYATNQEDNDANLGPLETCLTLLSDSIESVDADTDDIGNRMRSLVAGLTHSGQSGPPRVTLDISVMSNRLVLQCMNALLESNIHLRVAYAEAEIYHPTKAEYELDPAAWQSDRDVGLEEGVLNISVCPDFAGHHVDPLPDCLILFPTFKRDRSHAIISYVDPSLYDAAPGRIVWLLGVPHLVEDRWRLDAMRQINGLDEGHCQFEVETFDYKAALAQLESIYQMRWRDYRLTLSPLGSKLQALGTAIFHQMHPDVRVIFASPKRYNAKKYSQGCKALWQVDFGPLQELRQTLSSIGCLTVETA
jgi:hypothetical protein